MKSDLIDIPAFLDTPQLPPQPVETEFSTEVNYAVGVVVLCAAAIGIMLAIGFLLR